MAHRHIERLNARLGKERATSSFYLAALAYRSDPTPANDAALHKAHDEYVRLVEDTLQGAVVKALAAGNQVPEQLAQIPAHVAKRLELQHRIATAERAQEIKKSKPEPVQVNHDLTASIRTRSSR